MRAAVHIFLVILFPLVANAQSFTIFNYSVPEGLPSSEVYEVYQDRKGFLWFATDNGVVKFDGSQMKVYHTKDGLTDPVVFSFFEDHRNRLWFRTFSGELSYFENDSIKAYKFNKQLAPYNFWGLFSYLVTEEDELWFTVRNILGHVDATGRIEAKKIKDDGVYAKKVGDQYIMGGAAKSLDIKALIIDDQKFVVSGAKNPYFNRVLRNVRWKGKTYFSLNREVYAYDGKSVVKVVASPNPIINLSIDREDHLWVGSLNGGVTRYTTDDFRLPWSPFFLEKKSVTKVFQDHEGGLWFSTLENGIFHVPNLMISHYPLEASSRVRSVVASKEQVWVGEQNGTIFQVDARTKKTTSVIHVENSLLSMFYGENTLAISTTADILFYDHQLHPREKYAGLANDFCADKEGDIFTVGGFRLRKFDNHGVELSQDTVFEHHRSVLVHDTLLFLSNRLGMQVRNKKLVVTDSLKDFIDLKVSNILAFNDTTILITTLGKGFVLMDSRDRTYKMYNSENNFIADNIYSSLLNDSLLWLGTEKGLVKIPLSNFNEQKFSFSNLSKKSGLISDKIDFLVEVDNAVWAFAENGFSIIPHSFKFSNTQPLFYFKEIKVNEALIFPSRAIDLSHRQNNIELSFGFISFNNPNIFLRYRLSASDNWIYTNSKRLLFSSLAPGRYDFELESSTDNYHWRQATPSMTFTIIPPWWTKWYTQLIAFCILAILGYWYFRNQQSIYRQKNHFLKIINDHQQKLIQSEIVTLERERNRISKELHDRVGTNLTAIKLVVSQLLKNYKEPLAHEVEDQFQVALTEIKEIIYGLTPPSLERYGLFTGLKNYIGKLNKSIPITISLKAFGKEINKHDFNIIVFRVIQELLTNSIKHSFAKNITIHLNSFDDVLNIVYEDDGVGFSYDPLQSGLGLDNIESRIHSVNGTLKFDSGKFGISYTIDIPVTLNKEVA
jgi:signal transduction histidine kinase